MRHERPIDVLSVAEVVANESPCDAGLLRDAVEGAALAPNPCQTAGVGIENLRFADVGKRRSWQVGSLSKMIILSLRAGWEPSCLDLAAKETPCRRRCPRPP